MGDGQHARSGDAAARLFQEGQGVGLTRTVSQTVARPGTAEWEACEEAPVAQGHVLQYKSVTEVLKRIEKWDGQSITWDAWLRQWKVYESLLISSTDELHNVVTLVGFFPPDVGRIMLQRFNDSRNQLDPKLRFGYEAIMRELSANARAVIPVHVRFDKWKKLRISAATSAAFDSWWYEWLPASEASEAGTELIAEEFVRCVHERFEDIATKLVDHESTFGAQNLVGRYMFVSERVRRHERLTNMTGSTASSSTGFRAARSMQVPPRVGGACYNCGDPDHWANRCPKPRRGNFFPTPPSNFAPSRASQQAFAGQSDYRNDANRQRRPSRERQYGGGQPYQEWRPRSRSRSPGRGTGDAGYQGRPRTPTGASYGKGGKGGQWTTSYDAHMSPATRQARRDGGGSRDDSGGQDRGRQRSRTPPTPTARRSKPAADKPDYPRSAPVRQLEGGEEIHYEEVDEE